MAVILHQKVLSLKLGIEIDAAGTEDYHVGSPPDRRSIQHAAKRGYDLTSHRARQVIADDFETFDLIFAADKTNLRSLKTICPSHHQSKIFLFLGTEELPDPYYGGAEGFEKVLDLIEQRAEILVKMWQEKN